MKNVRCWYCVQDDILRSLKFTEMSAVSQTFVFAYIRQCFERTLITEQ